MQGVTLARILQSTIEKLRVNDLVGFLDPYVTGASNTAISDVARGRFSDLLFGAAAGLSEVERAPKIREVLDRFGLLKMFQYDEMGRMISAFGASGDRNTLVTRQEFVSVRNLHARLEAISHASSTLSRYLLAQRVKPAQEGDAVIELVIYSSDSPTPGHVSEILTTLQELHDHIARALGEASTLTLSYIDSGSDLLVGLSAKAKVASEIGSLLSKWWDYAKYRDLADLDRTLETIAKGTETVIALQKLESNGGPSAEAARKLQHGIMTSLVKVISLGAKAHSAEDEETERKLIAAKRDPKLLPSGSGDVQGLSKET